MRSKVLFTLILMWSIFMSIDCFAQENRNNGTTENTDKHEFRYTNPITRDTTISMRDHCIIKANKYYLNYEKKN